MAKVEIGHEVEDFSAPITGAETFQLSAHRGKNIIVYFYPKDNTPGCTTEGQNFRDLYPDFTALNTMVVGVSKDSLRTHENYKAKHNFPFELITDPDETVCKHFDVIKLKKLYGKEYMGIERSTFLIDTQGVLRQEWRKVKVKGHADAVLEAVKAL